MWTTAVNVEQGSKDDVYDNDDDKDKAYLMHHKIMHLFKTLLEEHVLCGIQWDELRTD